MELKVAQLKGEGTLHCTAAQKSAIVMWRTIENRQHHSVGGWVVKEGRKQRSRWASGEGRTEVSVARSPQGSMRRGGCAPSPRPPVAAQGLRYQLTMGSTSGSRSKSSWISSVLPESLLATELGDGEFLQSVGEKGRLSASSLGPLTS